MLCKHCGKPIDIETMRCTGCSVPAVTQGGVGFWDLAGEAPPRAAAPDPAQAAAAAAGAAAIAKTEKRVEQILSHQKKAEQRGNRIITVLAVLVAVSLLLNLLLVFQLNGVKKDLEQHLLTHEEHPWEQPPLEEPAAEAPEEPGFHLIPEDTLPPEETAAAETEPQTETTPPWSETESDPAETDPTQPATEPEETMSEKLPAEPTEILKQPTDVRVTDKLALGEVLFVVELSGEIDKVVWQKEDANGDWRPISRNLFDAEYDAQTQRAVLKLRMHSDDIYGTYRCVITDTEGLGLITDSVRIQNPDAQEAKG